MNVIFLDIDGVLNNDDSLTAEGCYSICPDMVIMLKRIINATKAKIVLSSTWRLYPESVEILKEKTGLELFGMTKQLRPRKLSQSFSAFRCDEITEWLSRHEVDQFAIIDDDTNAEIKGHFFKTKMLVGLTEEIADDVINHFDSEDDK